MPSMGGGGGGGSMPSPPGMGGGGGAAPGGGDLSSTRMTEEDVQDIQELVQGLSSVTIYLQGDVDVYGGELEEAMSATVVGAQAAYQDVSNLEVAMGRFLNEDDEASTNYVAVIGWDLAQDVFGSAMLAVGDYLEIEDKNYQIVGVLTQMGSVSSGISPDEAVFLPYSTAEKYVFGTTVEPTLAAVAENVEDVERCMADIEAVLSENYPDAYFEVTDAGSAMEAASSSAEFAKSDYVPGISTRMYGSSSNRQVPCAVETVLPGQFPVC